MDKLLIFLTLLQLSSLFINWMMDRSSLHHKLLRTKGLKISFLKKKSSKLLIISRKTLKHRFNRSLQESPKSILKLQQSQKLKLMKSPKTVNSRWLSLPRCSLLISELLLLQIQPARNQETEEMELEFPRLLDRLQTMETEIWWLEDNSLTWKTWTWQEMCLISDTDSKTMWTQIKSSSTCILRAGLKTAWK